MAVLYVTEYAFDARGGIPAVMTPSVVDQTVAIGGASVQSAVFNALTTMVRLHTDAVCSVKFGANPTASATTMRLAANQTEYLSVSPGQRVAVIANT